jgi:hypothetical protein
VRSPLAPGSNASGPPSLWASVRREWQAAGAFLVGLLLLAMQHFSPGVPWPLSVVLFFSGTALTTVASAQLGVTYLRSRDAEHAKALLRPPFRRTIRLYRLMDKIARTLESGHQTVRFDDDADGRVSVEKALFELERVDVLLESREDYQDALAEWEESLPSEARELWARLAEED